MEEEKVLTIVIVLGSLMYVIEGGENGFTSIPQSIYWSIVTLTTVGYGDISPKTGAGQALAAVIMILGYGIIAVPTGIITVEFSRAVGGYSLKKAENRRGADGGMAESESGCWKRMNRGMNRSFRSKGLLWTSGRVGVWLGRISPNANLLHSPTRLLTYSLTLFRSLSTMGPILVSGWHSTPWGHSSV